MKTKLLLLLGLPLCCGWGGIGEQTAEAQAASGPLPNADPEIRESARNLVVQADPALLDQHQQEGGPATSTT